MASQWSLTPLKSPLGPYVKPGVSTTGLTAAPRTSSYTVSPITSSKTFYSTGQTMGPMTSPSARSNAITSFGNMGSGSGQPGTNMPASTQRSPYSQPPAAPAGTSAGPTSPQRSGVLSQPGAYEDWYRQNASRYNQPTSLSSYWSSISGKFGGQRYQPTTSRDAFNTVGSGLRSQGAGTTNAYGVSGQLRNTTQGEGYMNTAAGMLGGVNNTAQYYGDNRNFFESPGAIEDYFAANGDRFQQAGFGEQNAQGILQDPNLTGLYDNRLVGNELDYFRQPLRDLSYSEKLYESGNQGLNQWYDLQRQRQQEDLENQMSAMGVFGSGETAEAMYRMREGLAAEQARDMAGLAGQADAERRARADLLFGAAGSAADEELARGGLMLDSAGMGLQLDRDAISRLSAGGDLANAASRYGLDRVTAGGDLARSADDSILNQARGLGDIGQGMATTEIDRLYRSGTLGLDADAEDRSRITDYYGMASDVDQLGLDADQNELDWLRTGAGIAGDVDQGNLDWLNAGGGAADTAQTRFENRERYGFTDPLAAGTAMGNTYGNIAGGNTTEQGEMKANAIDLIMKREGLSASGANIRAQQYLDAGYSWPQILAMFGGG